MKINKISFGNKQQYKQTNNKNKSNDILEKFYTNCRNSADMTDSILVPRTIFKGYLGIMAGTSLLTLGSILSNYKKISKSFSILGTITSLYGTWAFVRPFIIKDSKGVTTAQELLKVKN